MHVAARLSLIALTAVLTVTLARGTDPADARSRFKTVTRTFTNSTPITIPGAGTGPGYASFYPSTITISGLKKGRVLDVDVVFHGYSHARPDDIDVKLVGPRGQQAILMSDVGGSDDASFVSPTLDDEAAQRLNDQDSPPGDGRYRPYDYDSPNDAAPDLTGDNSLLSQYDDTNPNGMWSLFIYDDETDQSGGFSGGWSLIVKAKIRR